MIFDTPTPDTPPVLPDTLATSRSGRFRLQMEAALLNHSLLSVLLLIVLIGLVARTLLFARETPNQRALSDLYQDSYEALNAAKVAYSPDLILAPPAPNPGVPVASPHAKKKYNTPADAGDRYKATALSAPPAIASRRFRHPVVTSAATASVSQTLAQQRMEQAVRKWREAANSKQARAAEWRRLGIVLALFHAPGALEALAHVGDKFPPPPLSRSRARRASLQAGNSNLDPFGHGRTGVSAAQELATWQALYGAQTVTPTQVPGLRSTLQQLRLGWFENIALAQLFQKAGLPADAAHAAQEANRTAGNVRAYETIQTDAVLLGFLGLFFWGVSALARRLQFTSHAQNQKTAHPFTGQTSAPTSIRDTGLRNTDRVGVLANLLNTSRATVATDLLLAFLVYLVGHTVISLLASYALLPFAPQFDRMDAVQLIRLNLVLQFALYVPVTLLPLLALRARLARYHLSNSPLDLRTLLTHLGYRLENVFTEAKTALSAYILLLPGVLLAGMISQALFHRFHTPINPAQFQTMAARHLLDKVLIFVVAAVVAPLVEETMFRGLLYSALRARFGVMGAAMLSAAVFSLVHPTLPGGFLTIWAIGIALALVYERRGSLVPGMILHGIYNGLITLSGFAIFGN